ncbi:MAG: polyhydroxyalkanoate synthesis regulator DNA-binding domain-containing protein [Myxococcota bacterium]|nr:polyhydroxyalkanoate synthesis regulator DNA-binding domain-containing protein [Myxococcota bacterium]
MTVLIKRYANRKLYNTETSRYITLKGISELMEEGREVRVIDNESGEDITNVALSQILVDSERRGDEIPKSLLSDLFQRGGDALYGALRRGVGEATDGLDEFRDNLRKMVTPKDGERIGDWIALATPDFDRIVHDAVERVFKVLDLPRRSDIDALNRNLERVADAVDRLESTRRQSGDDAGGEAGDRERFHSQTD